MANGGFASYLIRPGRRKRLRRFSTLIGNQRRPAKNNLESYGNRLPFRLERDADQACESQKSVRNAVLPIAIMVSGIGIDVV